MVDFFRQAYLESICSSHRKCLVRPLSKQKPFHNPKVAILRQLLLVASWPFGCATRNWQFKRSAICIWLDTRPFLCRQSADVFHRHRQHSSVFEIEETHGQTLELSGAPFSHLVTSVLRTPVAVKNSIPGDRRVSGCLFCSINEKLGFHVISQAPSNDFPGK